jgi:hypothetical protein
MLFWCQVSASFQCLTSTTVTANSSKVLKVSSFITRNRVRKIGSQLGEDLETIGIQIAPVENWAVNEPAYGF